MNGRVGAVTAADRTLFLRRRWFFLVAAVAVAPVLAQITREAALTAVYPGATVRAEQVFLTPSQRKQVLMRGEADVLPSPVARYLATKDGKVVGRAYVDTHAVGIRQESLMVSLDAAGQVLRIDVTTSQEPLRPVTGASLTARETTSAVRRVQAIDAVLEKKEPTERE